MISWLKVKGDAHALSSTQERKGDRDKQGRWKKRQELLLLYVH